MPPLTDLHLRNLQPRPKVFRVADARGLCIEIHPSGARHWRYRYRFAGKAKMLSLGSYPAVSLSAARRARDDAERDLLQRGVDPSAQRKASRMADILAAASTFEAVASEWIEKAEKSLAPVTARKIRFYLDKDLLPAIGKRPIGDITRPELVATLRRIERREAFNAAKKSRGWLRQIFRYALAAGLVERNPATDLDVVAAPAPATKHYAHLPLAELGDFLRALDCYQGSPTTKACIRLALLTAARPGELRHARWAEFDMDAGTWQLTPGEGRGKLHRWHTVPLPAQAIVVLRELHELTGRGELTFPGVRGRRKPMSENTMNLAMQRMGYKNRQTGHGFRHLISTALNERGYNRDWVERQLAHRDSNAIRDTYNHAQYIEQRRTMMQTWADYLDSLQRGESKVVPIKRAS